MSHKGSRSCCASLQPHMCTLCVCVCRAVPSAPHVHSVSTKRRPTAPQTATRSCRPARGHPEERDKGEAGPDPLVPCGAAQHAAHPALSRRRHLPCSSPSDLTAAHNRVGRSSISFSPQRAERPETLHRAGIPSPLQHLGIPGCSGIPRTPQRHSPSPLRHPGSDTPLRQRAPLRRSGTPSRCAAPTSRVCSGTPK